MKRYFNITVLFFLALLASLNFYLFSRLTVDDAFISWRYGKNLVEAGIWGYNPSVFDLTQAYTNPLMSGLSIIPVFLGMDVVVFFKIIALLSLLLPFAYLLRSTVQPRFVSAMLLLLFALPATMIHAFAGLETFLFVSLMGLLFIALIREKFLISVACAALLLFVRPEAWLLLFLVPAYYLFLDLERNKYRFREIKKFRRVLYSFAALWVCFIPYALFHKLYFGYVFPNTFYVKYSTHFQLFAFIGYVFFLSPAFVLIFTRYKPLLAFIALFYLPVIYSYSTADLQMDYVGRFAYQVFAPIYLFMVYLATLQLDYGKFKLFSRRIVLASGNIFFLLVFAYLTCRPLGLVGMANYYPRLLDAHAALGKTIARISPAYHLQSIAYADAGAIAYHSHLIAFDNNGLGSSVAAHQGVSQKLIEAYNPDVVMLIANAQGMLLRTDKDKQLLSWAQHAGYSPQCEVYLAEPYRIQIFSAQKMPELEQVCTSSKERNNVPEWAYFLANNRVPPWHFWHE